MCPTCFQTFSSKKKKKKIEKNIPDYINSLISVLKFYVPSVEPWKLLLIMSLAYSF